MDLSSYPLEDGFETTLTQALTAVGTTMYVNSDGDFAFPASVTTYAVVNAGKSNVEVIELSAKSSNSFTIANRNITKGASVTTTAQAHAVGSKVIISDNYQFWKDIVDAVNAKLDSTQANANFDQTVTGTDWRIREDSGNMKFTDDSQAEVSLATLAAAAGVDDKVKVSNADTTSGYLEDKVTAGDGLSGTITSPAGNEAWDFDVDLTDTTTFRDARNGNEQIGVTSKAVDGKIDETFLQTTDANITTLTDGSDASTLHLHDETINSGLIDRNVFSMDRFGTGGGTITDAGSYSSIMTAAVNNSMASKRFLVREIATMSTSNLSVHDKNPEFYLPCKYSVATAQDGFIGCVDANFAGTSLEDAVMTLDHFGFVVADGVMYISCADGATQTKTSIAATVTDVTVGHEYRATFDGTTATFYVDGASVGTIATNVPDGTMETCQVAVIADASAAVKVLNVFYTGSFSYDK